MERTSLRATAAIAMSNLRQDATHRSSRPGALRSNGVTEEAAPGTEQPLRFADGPTTSAEVLIDATPEQVWAVVSDIMVPASFSTELVAVEWLDGATAACEGARFLGRSYHEAVGEWETTSVVTACEEGRLLEWAVGDPADAGATWRFTITESAEGTLLTQWMRLGPGRSGLSRALDAMPDKESKIIANRLREHRANMERTLNGMKALAEQPE
jgi:hypothetical protein